MLFTITNNKILQAIKKQEIDFLISPFFNLTTPITIVSINHQLSNLDLVFTDLFNSFAFTQPPIYLPCDWDITNFDSIVFNDQIQVEIVLEKLTPAEIIQKLALQPKTKIYQTITNYLIENTKDNKPFYWYKIIF